MHPSDHSWKRTVCVLRKVPKMFPSSPALLYSFIIIVLIVIITLLYSVVLIVIVIIIIVITTDHHHGILLGTQLLGRAGLLYMALSAFAFTTMSLLVKLGSGRNFSSFQMVRWLVQPWSNVDLTCHRLSFPYNVIAFPYHDAPRITPRHLHPLGVCAVRDPAGAGARLPDGGGRWPMAWVGAAQRACAASRAWIGRCHGFGPVLSRAHRAPARRRYRYVRTYGL